MKEKIIIIAAIIVLIIITSFFIINKKISTGKIVTQQIKITPLNSDERKGVMQNIISSEVIKDIPEKYPISLQFFSFENGEKVWRDGFLVGKNKFLTKGEPAVYLTLHSKYISELNQSNLCEVMQKANKNGDLGFYTKYNKASLFVKYATLLKYRKCFGL